MKLNYFNFKKMENQIMMTNDFGNFLFVSESEFKDILHGKIEPNSDIEKKLLDHKMIYRESDLEFSSTYMYDIRSLKQHVNMATSLHIFVVTTACNMNCVYCQANNGKKCSDLYMTADIAKKAVDIALESPTRYLTFEFQGGEPLLNFDIVKYIVEYTEEKNESHVINFNIVTNLTLFTEEMIIKRYSQYETILKYRNIELLDDLAAYTKQSSNKVIADLEYAIMRKLIPEGHFGTDHMIILMSDDTYVKYQMHQTEFDRYYRKQLEERVRMEERSENIQSILNQGNIYIQAIRDSNAIIKDKEISQKLDKMEQIVTTIFHEVDINPGQAGKLGKFLSYYLPTMDKLLKAYIELGEKNVLGSNARKMRKEIEETLDTLNHAFEGILDKFYQEQELDIMSDIAAMKMMLKQDGLD